MKSKIQVITIDGPSGVGKTNLCQIIAQKLQWNILDSGMLYRILALSALQRKVDIKSKSLLASMALNLNFRCLFVSNEMHIIVENNDVTSEINMPSVSNVASCIAVFPEVRNALLKKQRLFRKSPGLITNGRDMGTIVFPDAIIKIFLDASCEERAKRRMLQLQKQGINVSFDQLLFEIKKRDDRDRNRLIAPLHPAKDALIFDSTNMSNEKIFKEVFYYIQEVLDI